MEQETGLDREAAMANMRFRFLETLCRKTVVRPHESKEHKRSMAIDRVLTGRFTAIPCFLGIMALVFVLTFTVIGGTLSGVFTPTESAARLSYETMRPDKPQTGEPHEAE